MTYIARCPVCHRRFIAGYFPDRATARLATHVARDHPDATPTPQKGRSDELPTRRI